MNLRDFFWMDAERSAEEVCLSDCIATASACASFYLSLSQLPQDQLIVFAGDTLDRLTNHFLPAAIHRVVPAELGVPRHSLVWLLRARSDAISFFFFFLSYHELSFFFFSWK
jgi:hypothetical protein